MLGGRWFPLFGVIILVTLKPDPRRIGLSLLLIHHRIGNDLEDSLIAASASGRAMRGLLDVREDVKQVFYLRMLIEGIEDIEVGYVLAVTDLEILYGFGIYGFKVTGLVFGHCIFLRVVLLT